MLNTLEEDQLHPPEIQLIQVLNLGRGDEMALEHPKPLGYLHLAHECVVSLRSELATSIPDGSSYLDVRIPPSSQNDLVGMAFVGRSRVWSPSIRVQRSRSRLVAHLRGTSKATLAS